ncbi:MAG TPA: disulfide bond formation protein B [Casimicrobiaceae bacterium]|jgi:disulfide bond formation protein DsbB|nr:disulfide bond formation protein B [Casimicrobiaceae bacterium]
MTPYAAVPLPWLGFIVALALLVEQIVLHGFVPATTMLAAFFQVGVLALLCAMLALIILPPRRVAYLLGFLVCAGLMGWALWLQFGLDLEPCPLCMFQRVALCLAGLVFLVAFLKNPRRGGAVFTAFMTLVFAGAGAALAARQVWLQTLPKDLVPSCGMGISYMLDTLPFMDVITKTLQGSGECAEKGWVFLNLSIAGWSLVFFVTMIVAAFALIRRD